MVKPVCQLCRDDDARGTLLQELGEDLPVVYAAIYKISGKYHLNTQTGWRREVIKENVGDMIFIGGWQPGIRVRCYKNLHLFIGPTLAAECLGAHLGIGF